MGRLILFLAAVGGIVYLASGWIAGRLGVPVSPLTRISASVIAAVLCWTAFTLWAADRMGGGGRDGGP